MDDRSIIDLFFARDERAITAFEASYRRLCLAAAKEITGDLSDAEECYSDTCFALWNTIPPQNPVSLCAYALRICRNLALNLVEKQNTQKRSAVIVELSECIGTKAEADDGEAAESGEIGRAVNRFLETLPKEEAIIFVRRYFCSQPVKEIAASLHTSENRVSKLLSRLRRQLKTHLEKEGIRI
ncbi:MAG: sigma-70 family RNA polymerase sigma factor [Clostridia bacterium]|nr:sigma-70 family RNA polymerase sigma factor [Clostridia bacterium]